GGSTPGPAPLAAALSAGRAPRAADKSKPPPCRRENQGIRAASLDHLNDPSGVLRRFRRYVLVSDGSGGPSRLTSSARFSPLHARGVADRRFWISAVSCRRPPCVGWTHVKRVVRLYHSTFGSSQGIWACSGRGNVERFRGPVLGKDLNRSESV